MFQKLIFISLLIAISTLLACAQEEQLVNSAAKNAALVDLHYYPPEKADVSEKDITKGMYILKNAYQQLEDNEGKYTYADHWNISFGLALLRADKSKVLAHLREGITTENTSICTVLIDHHLEKKAPQESVFYEVLADEFITICEECEKLLAEEKERPKEAKERSSNVGNYDANLVQLFREMGDNDQRYRGQKEVDWIKQTPLDERNQFLIDSLYQVYGTYIGKSLVGEEE